MFKKLFTLLLCVIYFVCAFTAAVAAARSGEFETQDVEFQAFVTNDVVEPIQITLTHVTDNYKLYYFLYSGNNYFSNEQVALGEYSVEVMVSGYDVSEFSYAYDKILKVEPASTAISFTIIADLVLTKGDYSGESGVSTGNELIINDEFNNNELTDLPTDEKADVVKVEASNDDSTEHSSDDSSQDSKEGTSTKSPYSLLISFAFSLVLILVAAFVLWKIKNR